MASAICRGNSAKTPNKASRHPRNPLGDPLPPMVVQMFMFYHISTENRPAVCYNEWCPHYLQISHSSFVWIRNWILGENFINIFSTNLWRIIQCDKKFHQLMCNNVAKIQKWMFTKTSKKSVPKLFDTIINSDYWLLVCYDCVCVCVCLSILVIKLHTTTNDARDLRQLKCCDSHFG